MSSEFQKKDELEITFGDEIVTAPISFDDLMIPLNLNFGNVSSERDEPPGMSEFMGVRDDET